MNFYLLAFLLLIAGNGAASPLGQESDEAIVATSRPRNLEDDDVETTTHPTFTVQRLDAPIERIEIRLIDDNTTHVVPEVVISAEKRDEDENRTNAGRDGNDEGTTTEQPTSALEPTPEPTSPQYSDAPGYSTEHSTEQPVVVGEDPYYYSTLSPAKQASAEVQAKAWISVVKFQNEEPEEECLANEENLTDEVIERLKSETAMYYRLVKQRNDQQKEFCGTIAARDVTTEEFRRCSNWRAEKLVYYYKLMRKTYCQVDNWPNSPKIKKTYGEYLNLFGTFYAFQK
ncbi:Protein CBG06695 [Caenorhabditis briggsae]|uniref:Protein CBG06695 n=1 Tax=Caenorhabditis briggsae TaxID=6238 RepID=A8X2V8_CAEBR|nr:Protein CBG06695 [Caenorhabditis briggsae]CAP26968.2 Protein CBG06695 [Caenorhabditis briggsae]